MKTFREIGIVILMFAGISCSSQSISSRYATPTDDSIGEKVVVHQDTITEKQLPVYIIDSCFYEVLDQIVPADTGLSYFSLGKTAYILSVSKKPDFYFFGIRPTYLDQLVDAEFSGVLKFKERLFLCYGELPSTFFSRLNHEFLSFRFYDKEYGSTRWSNVYLGGDVPTLKKIHICNGLTVYFEISICCEVNDD